MTDRHTSLRSSLDRTCDLTRFDDARRSGAVQVSTTAAVMKAFALTAVEYPELRRSYRSGLRTRMIEPSHSCGVVRAPVIASTGPSAPIVIPQIERRSLPDLENALVNACRAETSTGLFGLLRTPFGWLRGGERSDAATFEIACGASSCRSASASSIPRLVLRRMDAVGRCSVRLEFDARLVEAPVAVAFLHDFEDALNGTIRQELESYATTARVEADADAA